MIPTNIPYGGRDGDGSSMDLRKFQFNLKLTLQSTLNLLKNYQITKFTLKDKTIR